jgi:voltage-gated potassium channel
MMFSAIRLFMRELKLLIGSPFFILLTIFGNTLIGLASITFYHLEVGKNSKVVFYMDAIWWGFSTATTTGYGDITPVTMTGKLLGIALMLLGLALFAVYTALLAETILASRDLFSKRDHLTKDLK